MPSEEVLSLLVSHSFVALNTLYCRLTGLFPPESKPLEDHAVDMFRITKWLA